jgi:hypothetical protein
MRMGATHFLMKQLPKVAIEMALHVAGSRRRQPTGPKFASRDRLRLSCGAAHTLGMALLSYTPYHWVIRRIPQLALAEDGWC